MSSLLTEPVEIETPKAEKNSPINGPRYASHPEYFQERQKAAWEKFLKLPLPKRTDESWRFADVKSFASLPQLQASQPTLVDDALRDSLLFRSKGLLKPAGRLVFANDQLIQQDAFSESLKAKGVIWKPLAAAISDHRELIEQHFMKEPNGLGSEKFAALHQSQASAGTFLYVPKGVEIDLPLETFHWVDGENVSIFPHTLIIADERSKVTLIDHFGSADEQSALAVGVNDIFAAAGSHVTYVSVQQWSARTLAFHLNNTVTDRDANALSLMLNLGGSVVRTESTSRMFGPGGRSDMLSISAASDNEVLDQRTLQIHAAPNTSSDLLYKNALDDKARTIFTGLIRVETGAHKTDAYQKVRNLLLNDEAEANSAPGLEIEADDVRCSHGATTGQVDLEQMFYLQSRGISPESARKLIVFGFLNEVLDRLPLNAVQDHLRELLHARLD